jgi:hypothetical protein
MATLDGEAKARFGPSDHEVDGSSSGIDRRRELLAGKRVGSLRRLIKALGLGAGGVELESSIVEVVTEQGLRFRTLAYVKR